MRRIFSLILVLMAVQMMFAAKITVTNTSDDVEEEGSLRWACKTATAEDTIDFYFGNTSSVQVVLRAKEIGKVIHIKSPLSTVASIDGSTCADSIIIDGYDEEKGTKANFNGLNGTGPFVKNIIVQNCLNGFSPSRGTVLYDCIARDCVADGFHSYGTGSQTYLRCKSLNNGGMGINFYYTLGNGFVEDCDIIGNGDIGVYGPRSVKNSRICDNKKYGIDILNTNAIEISDCVISGNDSIGILLELHVALISNNIIGLTADQKKPNPNGYGIYVLASSVSIDSVKNNIISGNRLDGVRDFANRGGMRNFVGNYVGTNIFFDTDPSLGNGGNGFVRGEDSDLISLEGEVSNNYFGNNGGYGVLSMNTLGSEKYFFYGTTTMKNCYFGVTPDGSPMPNGKGGLKYGCETLTLKNCHIGYNEGSGLDYPRENGGNLTIEGGSFIYNKKNGIIYNGTKSSSLYLNVKKAVFDSNGKDAISFSSNTPVANTLLSDNKFLNTIRPYSAFETTAPYPVPEFTSCKMTKTTIVIEGKIDTAAKAKIELFYTSQGEQTAEMLVDSFYTNADGTFSDTLDRSMFVGKSVISFNATATYGKITSPLSDLVSPSLGRVDLASTEFYVKMDGYGDGSSWDNAMNLQTFIYYLPQVMNGSTFYVAEGRYVPTSKGFKINSSVSIVGGFSPDATSGAVADPVRYKTVFTGDPSGDDVVVEKSLNYEKDIIDQSGDDVVMESSIFSGNENSEIHFSGCEISGNKNQNTGIISPIIYCGNLYLSDCTIGNTCNIGAYSKKKMIAENCIFRNMFSHSSPSSIFCHDSVYVKNSTFENITGRNGSCFNRVRSLLDIKNSIFSGVDINDGVLIQSTNEVYLFNNTFVNVNPNPGYVTSYLFVAKDSLAIVGNIFKNCKFKSVANITDHTFIKHNLCENILGTDDDINTGDFADSVVDGVYNKTTGTFVPTYSDWGGYVPTIVTKSDTLPDGRSIRFSLNETKVLTDQRGVSRLPKTCMGAYEVECGSADTTFSVDTVQIGTKIYGQTFTKVGVHDSIFETLKSAADCDSIVMHKVIVTPDPKTLNYYVKMKKEGDGDGRDWDNAMDSVDFATYLPLAPDGATFYVAEGEYRPVYDYSLAETEYLSSRQYTVNSDVTIRGGYPSTAKGTNVESNPKKYKTIFDGLIKAGKEEANVNNLF
ncbi:MAG: right-handed parallel beta-helix repeat-containing protein, partial [Paludibacteraceae bacterium]|nr:right-handed parallel beta-helix repeat-containing protein [Paludibacteraceae bacterium]